MGLDPACFETKLHGCPGIQDAVMDCIWYVFLL